ncbi:hypothetical protein D3C86_1408870 [compost metagenome]
MCIAGTGRQALGGCFIAQAQAKVFLQKLCAIEHFLQWCTGIGIIAGAFNPLCNGQSNTLCIRVLVMLFDVFQHLLPAWPDDARRIRQLGGQLLAGKPTYRAHRMSQELQQRAVIQWRPQQLHD